MHRLGALPLMYEPGERWLYNMSCDLLGVLVARASAFRRASPRGRPRRPYSARPRR